MVKMIAKVCYQFKYVFDKKRPKTIKSILKNNIHILFLHKDGSDELSCQKEHSVTCKSDEFSCGNGQQCIPLSWVCDNEHVSLLLQELIQSCIQLSILKSSVYAIIWSILFDYCLTVGLLRWIRWKAIVFKQGLWAMDVQMQWWQMHLFNVAMWWW